MLPTAKITQHQKFLLKSWFMNCWVLINDMRFHHQLKTINCSRTTLHGVSFWPKSGHGSSVVLYLRRSLCPSSEIHNARTTIYSRGDQRADLRAPQFKCNYGISDALIEPFFTCRLLFSVHQLWSVTSLLSSEDISKYRSMSASCTCKLPEYFFMGNSCERHQWRAPATLWLPLVYNLSRESVLYVGMQPYMPHPQSTMVFINNCLRENRGTYCNQHLKNRITAGYKK